MNTPLIVNNLRGFVETVHYRYLEGSEKKNGLLAVTLKPICIPMRLPILHPYKCTKNGKLWLRIDPGGLTISEGYAWNLNTAAPNKWGKFASLPHDALYQFSGCHFFPRHHITRSWCDDMYYHLCEPQMAWAYRAGLFLGSWACWARKPALDEWVDPVLFTQK